MRPPVVLIPGNMCDARLWEPVAERLRRADERVHHAPPPSAATIADMAGAVLRAHAEPIVAIGFSMGAIVAAEMARRSPDRIAALALVAFNASADLPERAAVRPRQQAEVRAGRLATIVADELKPNYLAAQNRQDAAVLDTVMKMALALGPEVFVAQSEALRTRADLRPALPALHLPVLLACGSEDRLCPPAWHREWAATIGPHVRLADIAGAGHLLPLEQPHALAEVLLGWLAMNAPCRQPS